MDFLRRFLGQKPESEPWPNGPGTRAVTFDGGGNPIAGLLATWRLPILQPRAEIEARYGVVTDPIYNWPTMLLPDPVQLPGAMRSWSAYVHDRIPPQFPITQFSGLVWFEDDAETNLRRTASHIAETLGDAPIGQRWNTLTATWQADLAEIRLTAWPPHLQSHGLNNPAEDRNPRLRFACHVQVATGFCLALTADERRWVETSTKAARLANERQSAAIERATRE